MKTSLTWMAAAMVIGAAIGAAMGYNDARPWAFRLHIESASPGEGSPTKEVEPAPLAVVDEPTFEFGVMEMGTSMRHAFEVTNQGDAALNVTFLSNTCKCTAVEFDGQKVEPGDSMSVPQGETREVALEWVANQEPGPFRHGASLSTSDPSNSRLSLEVSGDVVESTTLRPQSLYFSGAQVGSASQTELFVMSHLDEHVEILSHQVTPQDLAEHVQIELEPAEPSELPSPEAKSGVKVVATLGEGIGVGSFSGELELETSIAKASKLRVPIAGVVRGDISIFGTGWIDKLGLLKFDSVDGSEGERRQLTVTVRGEGAGETELAVEKVDPTELQVSIGEPNKISDRLVQFPLVLEIPPGTRPLIRVGDQQGGEGEVVLTSTHPTTPEVRLRVRLVVKR